MYKLKRKISVSWHIIFSIFPDFRPPSRDPKKPISSQKGATLFYPFASCDVSEKFTRNGVPPPPFQAHFWLPKSLIWVCYHSRAECECLELTIVKHMVFEAKNGPWASTLHTLIFLTGWHDTVQSTYNTLV